MPIYALSGILLASGAALRGCCCSEPPPPAPECARVGVTLWAESWNIPSGSAAGTGSHASDAYLYDVVCGRTIWASRSAQTWSEFTNASGATQAQCSTEACGGAQATAYNAGSRMELSIPAARGASGVPRLAGAFEFDDTRIVQAGYTVWVKWSLAVTFRGIGGGALPAQLPTVTVEFTRGVVATYTTATDRTWHEFFTDTRTGGMSLTDLTANVYLT